MRTLDEFFAWAEIQQNLERFRPRRAKLSALLRNERMAALTALFDNPHHAYRVIHIAGSKGKGSTAHLLAQAFHAHGHRVGCYLSPHIADYRERFVLLPDMLSVTQRTAIAGELYATLLRHCGDAARPRPHPVLADCPPTTFEILTLYAFLLFRAAHCQWAVVECGLGGMYDSTNVVRPDITIITSIEREHVQYLGRRLTSIAMQKAGIIKNAIPVFLFAQQRRVRAVIARVARQRSALLFYVPDYVESSAIALPAPAAPAISAAHTARRRPARSPVLSAAAAPLTQMAAAAPPVPSGYRVAVRTVGAAQISHHLTVGAGERLLLPVQAANIGAAYLVSAYCLAAFSPARFRDSVARAPLPGRYECVYRHPVVYCDGAHTSASLAATVEHFTAHFGRNGLCIFGCGTDKRVRWLLRVLRGRFRHYLFTDVDAIHTMVDSRILLHRAQRLRMCRRSCVAIPSRHADQIARRIVEYQVPTLICGSFYIIAPLCAALREQA